MVIRFKVQTESLEEYLALFEEWVAQLPSIPQALFFGIFLGGLQHSVRGCLPDSEMTDVFAAIRAAQRIDCIHKLPSLQRAPPVPGSSVCSKLGVRFAVLDDCLPIPEEKFKKVIKENYFTNTKFDCQLKAEQVKKLCKLFIASSKGGRSKKLHRLRKAENSRLPVRSERHGKRRVDGDERRLAPVEEHWYPEHPRKRLRKAVISPPHNQPLPVILPSTVPPYVCKMPSDVDAYSRLDQYPYRERRNRTIVNCHDRDGYPERDYPHRDGRVPYIKRHDSYEDGQDIYLRGCDPCVGRRRASYLERRDAYRGGGDLDAGIRSSYGDGRDLYLEHRDPYTYLEAYGSYRRDPVSNGLDAYRGGEYRDSFRRVEELCRPYVFEGGNRNDNCNRDSYVLNLQRASYAGPIYSAEYPSRAGSAAKYHL
ncbi:hypothetical protein OROGR_019779 [Orobanche gracilis]